METQDTLTAIGIVLTLLAFATLIRLESLNKRDNKDLGNLREHIEGLEVEALQPVEPFEGAVTEEQRQIAKAIEITNRATIEALIGEKKRVLDDSRKIDERQAKRNVYVRAAQAMTILGSILSLVALLV